LCCFVFVVVVIVTFGVIIIVTLLLLFLALSLQLNHLKQFQSEDEIMEKKENNKLHGKTNIKQKEKCK
jgi:hypothetical protein